MTQSKLTLLQNELHAPKNQYNKFGKYNYRSQEDVLEALKPLLLKHGLELTISDTLGDCAIGSYVEATATLMCDGSVVAQSSAQAGIEKAGGMQMAQAYGSSSSYARKYALNGLFLIDDTKDPDSTNEHGSAPKQEEKQETIWMTDAQFESIKKLAVSDKAKAKKNFDAFSKKPYAMKKQFREELSKLLS